MGLKRLPEVAYVGGRGLAGLLGTQLIVKTLGLNLAPVQIVGINLAVQINGKVRTRISLPADLDKAAVEQAVLSADPVQPFLAGKTVRKVIVVKNVVNIVVG